MSDRPLSHADLCRLANCFRGDSKANLHFDQDRRINDWLNMKIAEAWGPVMPGICP